MSKQITKKTIEITNACKENINLLFDNEELKKYLLEKKEIEEVHKYWINTEKSYIADFKKERCCCQSMDWDWDYCPYCGTHLGDCVWENSEEKVLEALNEDYDLSQSEIEEIMNNLKTGYRVVLTLKDEYKEN